MQSVFEKELNNRLSGSVALSEAQAAMGAALDHPQFEDLDFGEVIEGEAAIMFLDIRGFTRLSMAFADDRARTARIIDAVVGAATATMVSYDAHINDFTGDGIMAVFGGDGHDLDSSHSAALFGVSHMMTEMSAVLRPELLDVGVDDSVQVAIGLVSGPVLWKRVGTQEASRVQAIGEVAPLAAKYVTGKQTKAWETMIGGEIANDIPDEFRKQVEPFVRTYDGQEMKRERWLFDTADFYKEAPSLEAAVRLSQKGSRSDFKSLTGGAAPAAKRHGDGKTRERTVG